MRTLIALVVVWGISACATESKTAPGAATSDGAAASSAPTSGAPVAAPSAYGDWEYVATANGKRTTGRFHIGRGSAPSRFVVDAAGVDSDVTDGVLTLDGERVRWRGVVASPGGSTGFEVDAKFVGPARLEGVNRLRQQEAPHRASEWSFVATRPVD